MKKKSYEKPTMCVYELQRQVHLLQASKTGGSNNPLHWGNPGNDQ